jgi:hypothetical protein
LYAACLLATAWTVKLPGANLFVPSAATRKAMFTWNGFASEHALIHRDAATIYLNIFMYLFG